MAYPYSNTRKRGIADYGKQTPMARVQPPMGDSIPMPQTQAARIGFDPVVTKGLAAERQARIAATPKPGDPKFKGPTIPAPADPTIGPARPTIPEYTASQIGRMTELNRQMGVLQALGQREGLGAMNAQTLKDYSGEIADIKQRPGEQTLGERMKNGANTVVETVKGAAGNVAEELRNIKLQDLGVGDPKMQDLGETPAKQLGREAGKKVKKTKAAVKEGVTVVEKGVGDFAEGYAEGNPSEAKPVEAGETLKDTTPPSEKAGNKVREGWDKTVGAAKNFTKGLRREPGTPSDIKATPEAKTKAPKVPGAPPGPVRQGLGMAGRGLGLAAVPAMADQIYREGPLEAGGQMLTGGLEAGADIVGAYQNMPPWEATKYAGRAALAGVGDMANDSLRVLTGAMKASNPLDPNAPSYDQAMEQIRADPSTRFGGIDALRETNRQAMSSAFTTNQQQKRQNLDNTFGLAKQIGPVQPLQGIQLADPTASFDRPPAALPDRAGVPVEAPPFMPAPARNFGQPERTAPDLTRALGVTPAAPVPGLSPPEELLQQPYDFAFNQMRQATAGEQPVSLMGQVKNGLAPYAQRALKAQENVRNAFGGGSAQAAGGEYTPTPEDLAAGRSTSMDALAAQARQNSAREPVYTPIPKGLPKDWTRSNDQVTKESVAKGPNGSGITATARNLDKDVPYGNYLQELAGTRSASGLSNELIAQGNKNIAEGRMGDNLFQLSPNQSYGTPGPEASPGGGRGLGVARGQGAAPAARRINVGSMPTYDPQKPLLEYKSALQRWALQNGVDYGELQGKGRNTDTSAATALGLERLRFDMQKEKADQSRELSKADMEIATKLWQDISSKEPGVSESAYARLSALGPDNPIARQVYNNNLAVGQQQQGFLGRLIGDGPLFPDQQATPYALGEEALQQASLNRNTFFNDTIDLPGIGPTYTYGQGNAERDRFMQSMMQRKALQPR